PGHRVLGSAFAPAMPPTAMVQGGSSFLRSQSYPQITQIGADLQRKRETLSSRAKSRDPAATRSMHPRGPSTSLGMTSRRNANLYARPIYAPVRVSILIVSPS